MPRRVEWPYDMGPAYGEAQWRYAVPPRPDTPIQAVMEAAPGAEPEDSIVDAMPLRELLADALDSLTERERWVFDAIVYRDLSLRQLAAELGLSKSYVARVRDAVMRKLQAALGDHPLVQSHLRKDDPA